jgi:hypothetical protein
MPLAAVLDSNVFRSTGDDASEALVSAERHRDVLALADAWTLIELLAHLKSRIDQAYWPCRRAIRRVARRCLDPRDGEPRVLIDTETQIARLLLGRELAGPRASTAEIVRTCQFVAAAEDTQDLSEVAGTIASLAVYVEGTEAWFAEFLRDLTDKLTAASAAAHPIPGDESPHIKIRRFLGSDDMLRLDAEALALRAYEQAGVEPPDPIPEPDIRRVMSACRAGSRATAMALERVLCDGAKLDKTSTPNLIWDQQIAFNIGQQVAGRRLVVVTDDGFFAQAAAVAGFANSVRSVGQYRADLGL